MDTSQFEQALYTDAKAAFEKIIEKHGEDLYVIGLYHFGGWDGVMPMFNTMSDLESVIEENCDEGEKDCEIATKWNPSDFPTLEQYVKYFENSEKEIQALRGSWDDSAEDMHQRWQQTLGAMESALMRLDSEGVFSSGVTRENVTLYIATYDEDYADGFGRIRRMNPEPVVQKAFEEFRHIANIREE